MSEVTRLSQEAQLLVQLVNRAAITQRWGSFSARNPLLGKMKTCPMCRIRERGHICRVKIKAPIDWGKSLVAKRRIVPRLTRKKPPLFLSHQILVEVESGARHNFPKNVTAENVEKWIKAGKKETARQNRNQQKLSRRINWRLA